MPKIPEETIQQVAQASDVAEVIGGYFPLKRSGNALKALCPFHSEKTPSFMVNPQRQTFHCFGCGAGGSVFRFVMLYENLDFPSAVRRLAERAGIQIFEEEMSADEQRKSTMRRRLLALHTEAAEWFHNLLMKASAGSAAREYLRSRGLNGQIAASWKIGYAPDSFRAFSEWARGKGYSKNELIQSGMVKLRNEENSSGAYYDRFRNRVMFPICNDYGEVIGFSGRTLEKETQTAKYLNSPETILFSKSRVLFGLHKAKRALIERGSAIVCEGQLDLITAFEAGIQNVIAPQGTAFTEKQARILRRFVGEVVLCFDADAAGEKAAERSMPTLLDNGLFVRVAEMPSGHDPDTLIRKLGADSFAKLIDESKDFFDAMIDRQSLRPDFATPRGKLEFAKRAAWLLSFVSDVLMRDAYVNKISARLEIPADDLRRLLNQQPRHQEKPEREVVEKPPELTQTFRLLCLLFLRHQTSNEWLRKQPWNEVLADEPGAELLHTLLRREFEPGDNRSIARLTESLTPGEESLVSSLLQQPLPTPIDTALLDCWNDVLARKLKRRIDALELKSKDPNLSLEDIHLLHKERVDLNRRLIDIARPSPPRS